MDMDVILVDSSDESDDDSKVPSTNVKSSEPFRYELNNERKCAKDQLQTNNKEVKCNIYPITIGKKRTLPTFITLILLSAIVGAVGVLLHYSLFHINAQIDVEKLEKDLLKHVFEQRDPVYAAITSLKQTSDWHSNVKILSFVGRAGVGKTFIANLIKRNFYHKLVNDLHGSVLRDRSKQDKVICNLYEGYLNLIIVDDLTVDDTDALFEFLARIDNDNLTLLVIAIFSIQKVDNSLHHNVDYHHIIDIHKEFDKSKLFGEVVVFDEFEDFHVDKWLEDQFQLYDVDLESRREVTSKIVPNHDVYKHGFKGLYSKFMKLLN